MSERESGFPIDLRRAVMSRRELLGAAAVGGAALAAGPLLSACGSSSTSSAGAGGSAAVDLNSLLGVDTANAAAGLTFNMGAVLALSGSGSYYGGVMSNGIDLAVAAIKAAGGPDIKVTYKDHKSGDAAAGATAVKELGSAGIHACLASYVDDLGAMFPGTAQYKMLTLDGGGGTSSFGQGKDYFWGTRAITPDDTFAGTFKYVTQKMPNVKSVQAVGWDLGPLDDPIIANLQKALQAAGLQYLGFERVPIGATDYSTALNHVKNTNPDLIILGIYGLDPGYFMKQYVTSGIGKAVIGSEFTPDAAKVAGSAYDQYVFAYDYFDAKNPPNPFAKVFVDSFKQKNGGALPDFYAANFYENTFAMWDLIRRVKKAGGDPTDGTALQQALVASPTFKSVYGGDANTVGTFTLDTTTHTVVKRPMGIFTIKGSTITRVASFGIGGTDFQIL